MNKKFSIVKTIDLDKLSNEINKYIKETGETNPYIFMHDDTADAIESAITVPYLHYIERDYVGRKIARDNAIAEFCGYKIFHNNSLKFGEIEIR